MINNEKRRAKEKLTLFDLPGTNSLISDVIDKVKPLTVSEKMQIIGELKLQYLKILETKDPKQQNLF